MTYDNHHEPDDPHDAADRATPTLIRTQADLEATWRILMEPLGFGGHSLWMMLITEDDVPIRHLTQIEDVVGVPAPDELAVLADITADIVSEVAPGGRVAFLRSRPGRDTASDADRALALALVRACAAIGQPTEVVHVANDVMLAALPLDELPWSASA